MFLYILFTVGVLWLLFVIPVRRKILIEGVFEEEKLDYDFFSGKPFYYFGFRDFCRSCMEGWQTTGKKPDYWPSGLNCYVGVPKNSIRLGTFKLKPGQSVKMIGWVTLLSRVRIYSFKHSDYVWVDPHKEELQLEAKARGFDNVEEYLKVREQEYCEKFYKKAMEENGLTREEAETLEVLPSVFDIFDKEAKRRGLSFLKVEERFYGPIMQDDTCYEIDFDTADYLAKELAVKKALPDNIRDHLNKCETCNGRFMMADWREKGMPSGDSAKADEEVRKMAGIRPAWEIRAERLGVTVEELQKHDKENAILSYGGKDCFTLKERVVYARTGELSQERFAHQENCIGCKRMIEADREDFLQTGKIGGLALKAWKSEFKPIV